MARIIAIGASQGGVQALIELVSGLGSAFPAPVLISMHIGSAPSLLASILSGADGSEARFARHGEFIEPGRIYIAPPDRHLLVNGDHLELSKGPRENWARPAIDPMFRSLAATRGPDAVGVVLSGRLNDGTAGLYEIKRQGGVALVQTPSEAEAPDMPASALENVPVDYCLPVREMPRLLARLAQQAPQQGSPNIRALHAMDAIKLDNPTAQTCPECGGAMREEALGTLTQFRCHTGHVMTAEVLAATQLDVLRNGLAAVLRQLNERAGLCREISEKHRARGDVAGAQIWARAAEEAARREAAAQALIHADWGHPETPAEAEAAE